MELMHRVAEWMCIYKHGNNQLIYDFQEDILLVEYFKASSTKKEDKLRSEY